MIRSPMTRFFIFSLLISCLTACSFSRKSEFNREFYVLDVVDMTQGMLVPEKAKFPDVILLIQPMRIAAVFDKKDFIYRTGPFSYETDYYRSFQVSPSIMIGEQVYEWFVTKKITGQVVRPDALVQANFALYGFVNEFYGDYSDPNNPTAVLSITYRLFYRHESYFSDRRMEKIYVQKISLKDREVSTLVAAYNLALKKILTNLSADLDETDFSIPSTPHPEQKP